MKFVFPFDDSETSSSMTLWADPSQCTVLRQFKAPKSVKGRSNVDIILWNYLTTKVWFTVLFNIDKKKISMIKYAIAKELI